MSTNQGCSTTLANETSNLSTDVLKKVIEYFKKRAQNVIEYY